MKTILVTGGTGFLGRHLIEELRRTEGAARLRVLCRGVSPWDDDQPPEKAPSELEPGRALAAGQAGVDVVRGDITSREDVLGAAAGASEIYHLAGVVSRNPKKKWLLYQTHIEGTRNICEAALKAGSSRIVHVSSSGTVAVTPDPVLHKENSGYKHEVVGAWPYYLSKIFAEKLALDYWERHRLPVVITNPSLLLGPGDERGSSTSDIALFLQGGVLAVPLGGLNFVDVRDVAAGLIAAMRSGRPGERYLLGGANWTFREFVNQLAQISGMRPPKLQPSLGTSLASARFLRRALPLVGKSFRLDDVSIRMSSYFWYCDSSKARAELGFQTRDPIETLRDTVEDLRRRMTARSAG